MSEQNLLFQAIDKQHQQLTELFLMHQEALLIDQLSLANTIYQAYYALQLAHLTFENTQLLPQLAELDDTRWPASLYQHEHNKVETLLNKHAEQLQQALDTKSNLNLSIQEYRRWLIDLFDQHKTLKGVLEHHEQREEHGMLSELGKALSQETLTELCQALELATNPALEIIYNESERWMKELNG